MKNIITEMNDMRMLAGLQPISEETDADKKAALEGLRKARASIENAMKELGDLTSSKWAKDNRRDVAEIRKCIVSLGKEAKKIRSMMAGVAVMSGM